MKGFEEISINTRRTHSLCRALRRQAENGLLEGGHVLKGMTVALEVIEIGVGRPKDFGWQLELRIGCVEIDKSAWITIR